MPDRDDLSRPTYRFSGIELDTGKRSIRVGDELKDVSPLVFETLEYLVSHAGEVVSKEQLANDLWRGRIVTDASIAQAIRKARSMLEECGVDPAIIRTRHGHGYQLDANVETLAPGRGSATGRASPGWRERRPLIAITAAALGGILLAVANISEIVQLFVADPSVKMLEEAQSTLRTTDEKIDEIVSLLKQQAAETGISLDLTAEEAIRQAVQAMIVSGDTRKQQALTQLEAGDTAGAAAAIVQVAEDFDAASESSRSAAAESWREAGAIYYSSNTVEAVRSYEAALELEPSNPLNHIELGFAYVRAGRLDDAIGVFDAALAQDLEDNLLAFALRGAGTVYRLQAEYDRAERALLRAREVAERSSDVIQVGKALLQLGSIAEVRGEYELARRHFEVAIEYAEEMGDQGLLADALNDLAIVLAETGQFDQAREHFIRINAIYTERHDLAGQAQAIGNLGATALKQGNLDEAETWLAQSVALGEQLGLKRSVALDLTNLGSISAQRGEFAKALDYMDQAQVIAEVAGLAELVGVLLVNKGEVAREQGDMALACSYWSEAYPELEAMGHAAAPTVAAKIADSGCPG